MTATDDKKLIFPPPDIKAVADKTATFIAKYGEAFEQKVGAEDNQKFAFLKKDNPYRVYFDHMVAKLKAGDSTESKPEVPQAILDMKAKEAEKKKKKEQQKMLTMGEDFKNKDIKKPPKDVFTCPSPFITAMDLDIIKLTAQFVARNGQKFLIGLSNREQRSPQFDFLKPTHALFGFFTNLVDSYTLCLVPQKDDLTKVDEIIDSSSKLLDNAMNRFFWDEKVESERASKQEREEREKEAMAMIDWHDFVPVETIEFTAEDENMELAAPLDPSTLRHFGEEAAALDTKEQERMKKVAEVDTEEVEMDIDDDDDDNMDVEGEEDDNKFEAEAAEAEAQRQKAEEEAEKEKAELEQLEAKEAAATIPLPEDKPMVIKKDYVRQKRAAAGASGKAAMMKCPITGQLIPADEMSKHLRILLLDPQWKQQKNKVLEEARKESAFADDVEANLLTFVNKRPDIFGTVEEQIIEAASGAAEAAAREAGADAGPAHSVYNPDAAAKAALEAAAAAPSASITNAGGYTGLSGSTTVPALGGAGGEAIGDDDQPTKRMRLDDGPEAMKAAEEFTAANPGTLSYVIQIMQPAEKFEVEAEVTDSIRTMKAKIAPNVPGLLMSKMQLRDPATGAIMTDTMNLAYYQLGEGATIEVHEKSRRG